MSITAALFEAYLKCPTKCFLRSLGEAGTGNTYADWTRDQNQSYRNAGVKRLMDEYPNGDCAAGPLNNEHLRAAKWKLGFGLVARGQNRESTIHAVERIPSKRHDQAAQLVPIRFVPRNKLTTDDKLLLAFDALVLSEVLGRDVNVGKIIHGDDHTTLRVNTSALLSKVRNLANNLTVSLSSNLPPDLVLNRHCAECEFKAGCRQKAMKTDDLSLLSGMSEKERHRQRSKGIFTVTQFSHTFRPRRTPKRAKNPAKPHYLALQALSIRENTVYIHGAPQLPTPQSQVFLDIEGLPDSEFYYLIGALFVINGQETFQSFWADNDSDEPTIFLQFLEAVCQLPDFRIFHFGNYETVALKRARQKLPDVLRPKIDMVLGKLVNVLSVVYPHIYFPTYSNGLKDIGRFLGYARADESATGLQTIPWRKNWEQDKESDLKDKLVQYNKDDCVGLRRLYDFVGKLSSPDSTNPINNTTFPKLGRTEELRDSRPRWNSFARREYALEDFHHVVKCAYFDYQREKVFVRTHRHFKTINKRHRKLGRTNTQPNRIIALECRKCPRCRKKKIEQIKNMSHTLIDLKFSGTGAKRWLTRFDSWRYSCLQCKHEFNSEERWPIPPKFGHSLMSWCVYVNAVCGVNMHRARRTLEDVFGIFLDDSQGYRFKRYLTENYQSLYDEILQSILRDPMLHVDETTVHLRGSQTGYVWVLASMDKVYYFYKSSREGMFLKEMLAPFSGVLVSDFYAAYDALECAQQKCLVHFVRDIDDDLLKNPLDTELKYLAQEFGTLLRTIIKTVDIFGLKSRHLRKHKSDVSRFLDTVVSKDFSSELVNKYKKRFHKSGAKMFTFLEHDGVPWNNNNAEHAIKRFVKYRRMADGYFSEETLKEYLILATVFETCEFNNVNILKFLLSKETTLAGLFKMAGRKVSLKPITVSSPPLEPSQRLSTAETNTIPGDQEQ